MAKKKGLTEDEWLACTKPTALLRSARSRISERKRRLFAAACCRRIWRLLADERSRRAVEAAERFADDAAAEQELAAAEEAANEACHAVTAAGRSDAANAVYVAVCQDVGWDIADAAARSAVDAVRAAEGKVAAAEEEAAQLALLRDVVGYPFRPSPVVDPAVLAWQGGSIGNMARLIYDARTLPAGALDGVRLGVLADALEDAGGDNAEILAHLRGPSHHVRGCWCIDLLTGRG